MNQIKSLFAFLFMFVATLFTASDAQAFALGNHAGGFFSGTLDCAGVDDPGTRNSCQENGWLKYDTLSGCCVGANKTLNFTQATASPFFSAQGKFAGRSIASVADDLSSGALKAADVPVEFIVRDGQRLIVNTRSSLALRQAGIPQSQWNLVNRTGVEAVEQNITNRLLCNSLDNAGTPEVEKLFELGTDLSVDDGHSTTADRKRHGLQRALTFALIQAWAKSLRRPQVKEGTKPRKASESVVFAFEEPELFLHPHAQRQLAANLAKLATRSRA